MQQLEFSSHPLSEAGVNGSAVSAPRALAEYWGAEELAATLDSVEAGVWVIDLEGRCADDSLGCHQFCRYAF